MHLTVIALGLAQTLAFGSTYYLPAILADPMAGSLGISPSWVFGALTTALLVSAALGPAAGRWIDRHGGRGILSLSSIIFAVGLMLLSQVHDLLTLGLSWVLIGTGMGIGLYDAAFATVASIHGKNSRGPITGITLIAGLASTVAWPLTAWIEAHYGWRVACQTWAALHATLGLGLHLLLIPPPARLDDVHADAPAPVAPSLAGHGRTITILAFVFGAIGFMSTSLSSHLPRVLELGGASPAAAVAAAALVGPAQVGARLIEYQLMRDVHPLHISRMALCAGPLAVAVLLLGGAPVAAIFTVVHGAGNGVLTIAKGTLPLALFGPVGYGHRQGLINAPGRVVQALSPLVFGLLIERFGMNALLFSACLGLLALAALMLLKPTETHG